jgi:hypothetical protein
MLERGEQMGGMGTERIRETREGATADVHNEHIGDLA